MKKLVILFGIIFILAFASFISANPACEANINVDTTLDGNLTCNGTALIINGHNVILDCAGYTINYSVNGTASTYGIYAAGRQNITIKNCNIVDGNWTSDVTSRYAIAMYNGNNATIYNVSVNNSGGTYAMTASVPNSNFSLLNVSSLNEALRLQSDNNSFRDVSLWANYTRALWVYGAHNNVFHNLVSISNLSYGIYIYNSDNNSFYNSNGTSLNGVSTNGVGAILSNGSNTFFQDSLFSGDYRDFRILSTAGSVNNTLLNCSYDSEQVEGASNFLIRKWYYDANITFSNGTAIFGVNITAYNTSGGVEFSVLTNSSGFIEQQNITDYINLGGTQTFNSNYTVNATNGSIAEYKFLNITLEENTWDAFVYTPIVVTSNTTNTTTTTGGGSSATPSTSSLDEGYTTNFRRNFKLNLGDNTMTLTELQGDTATIEIAGSNYEINEDETVKIDTDSDGYYDVQVSAGSVNEVYATLTVKTIYEEVPASEQEGQISEVQDIGQGDLSNFSRIRILIGIAGLILIGFVGYKIFKKK